MEAGKLGVEPCGGHCGHEQGCFDSLSAALSASVAIVSPALARVGGKAGQGCGLAPCKGAKLGHESGQFECGDRSDTGDGLQRLADIFERCMVLDQGRHVAAEVFDCLLQSSQHDAQALGNRLGTRGFEAIDHGGALGDKIAPGAGHGD